MPKDEYKDLEEHPASEKSSGATVKCVFVFIFFSIALLLNSGITVFIIPKFKKIFLEMFEGDPLPLLTVITMDYSPYLLTLDYFFLLILVGLIAFGKIKSFLTLGTILIFVLFLKMILIIISLFLPLLTIIEKLGAG